MLTRETVLDALSVVKDPELDEPITDLGFVESLEITDRDVSVRLRLPTSFCAPNFAYLMASDSMDALKSIPDVGKLEVLLDGNTDSDRINSGIAEGLSFVEAYSNEAEEELDELRLMFQVKAHLAALERVMTFLSREYAYVPEQMLELTVGELPEARVVDALLNRRADIGLPNDSDQYILVDDKNNRWDPDSLESQMRFAKATRVSVDGNAHFCRGLLRTRYPGSDEDQAPREQDLLSGITIFGR
jgi:metal-sulfur cluster biosynthetic enzyme